ncbi:bacteriophage protein, partial [Klebsiella pneumoniae]|nr:bacteriophage protein [Klebsiella pneumoniae]
VKKIRLGAVLYSDFKQARNPAFHRKFFALLNLGFDYWQPSGGAISPADKKLVRGYVQLVAHYAGHGDTLQELADQYLRDEAEKRAGNISAVKSFEAFRAWVTIEAGFYNEYQMPDGPIRKEPKSISFAKMDDLEFSQLYKSVLDVLWN